MSSLIELLLFGPGVFQTNGLVKDGMCIAGVAVWGEIADTLELQIGQWLHRSCKGLHIAVGEDMERIRIDNLLHGGHGIAVLLFTDGESDRTGQEDERRKLRPVESVILILL